MTSYYLNTDLDLASSTPFDEIMNAFSISAEVLHYGRGEDGSWYATIEAAGSGHRNRSSPEEDIESLLQIIESLGQSVRAGMNDLNVIDFNIGWQAAIARPEGRFELSGGLLARLGAIGAKLSTTIYPSSENDDEDAEQGAQPDAFGAH